MTGDGILEAVKVVSNNVFTYSPELMSVVNGIYVYSHFPGFWYNLICRVFIYALKISRLI